MFCDACGAPIEAGQNFCPRCGKAFGVAATTPARSRIAGHLRVLGILWLVLSGLRLLPGLFLLFLFRPEMQLLPPDVPAFVPHLVRSIGFGIMLFAVLGGIVGWGLLSRQSWGRMLALVLGCLNLLDFPLGTALGIYTLWVLLPAQSGQEYQQLTPAV
jgi:hypothetical protein